MAVTDLTDSLPYWARGGAQGPGATGGPGAAPMGSGGAPGASSADWLRYLMAMANQGGGNPANMPSPDASETGLTVIDNTADHGTGDNPPVRPFAVPPAPPAPPAQNDLSQNSPSWFPSSNTPTMALPSTTNAPPPGTMPARPAGVSASGLPLQPGSLSPAALAQFGAGAPTWPSGGGSINPAAPPPPGQAAPGSAAPVPGPLSTGGASGSGSTANPRFIGIDRPNADPQSSMQSAMRRGPQGTALNLAGLFGGGQNPNVPAANAQPMSGRLKGPLAKGQGGAPSGDNWDIDADGNIVPRYGPLGKTTKAPSDYGPLQRGRTWGYKGGIPT